MDSVFNASQVSFPMCSKNATLQHPQSPITATNPSSLGNKLCAEFAIPATFSKSLTEAIDVF